MDIKSRVLSLQEQVEDSKERMKKASIVTSLMRMNKMTKEQAEKEYARQNKKPVGKLAKAIKK